VTAAQSTAFIFVSGILVSALIFHATAMTNEEAQQAFLSRVLLTLGSFVILCLLLF
jgi:hypothetical protein